MSSSPPPGAPPSPATEVPRVLAGKYMIFRLGDGEYGFEILKVREIIGLMEITTVPRTRDYFRGVINLRGKVIPVLDLRRKFAMAAVEPTDQTVIIVVQVEGEGGPRLTVGILVDRVIEVLSVDATQVEPPPTFAATSVDVGFIKGIGKADKRVIFLLDIGRVLAAEDSAAIEHLASAP